MTSAPSALPFRCVESPPLPRPVALYSLRRELRTWTPPKAFWIGVLAGASIVSVIAGVILS